MAPTSWGQPTLHEAAASPPFSTRIPRDALPFSSSRSAWLCSLR